jgi:hypothetical protein
MKAKEKIKIKVQGRSQGPLTLGEILYKALPGNVEA